MDLKSQQDCGSVATSGASASRPPASRGQTATAGAEKPDGPFDSSDHLDRARAGGLLVIDGRAFGLGAAGAENQVERSNP